MTIRITEHDQKLLLALHEQPATLLVGYNTATLAKARMMGWIVGQQPHRSDLRYADQAWTLTPSGAAIAQALRISNLA